MNEHNLDVNSLCWNLNPYIAAKVIFVFELQSSLK